MEYAVTHDNGEYYTTKHPHSTVHVLARGVKYRKVLATILVLDLCDGSVLPSSQSYVGLNVILIVFFRRQTS